MSGPQEKRGGATSSTCWGERRGLVGRAVDGRRETQTKEKKKKANVESDGTETYRPIVFLQKHNF